MYGTATDINRVPLTVEFDYKWEMVKSVQFQRTMEHREAGKRWLDSEGADWVFDPKGMIKKANLTFIDKLFLLLVRHLLFMTIGDNILTWDRAVLVESLVADLEINFAKLLITVIHERAFKSSTT